MTISSIHVIEPVENGSVFVSRLSVLLCFTVRVIALVFKRSALGQVLSRIAECRSDDLHIGSSDVCHG